MIFNISPIPLTMPDDCDEVRNELVTHNDSIWQRSLTSSSGSLKKMRSAEFVVNSVL